MNLQHGDADIDPLDMPSSFPDQGVTSSEEEIALDKLVSSAHENGITAEDSHILQKYVYDFRKIWRIGLSNDPPAKVAPIVAPRKPS
jgi:hypothetical protein